MESAEQSDAQAMGGSVESGVGASQTSPWGGGGMMSAGGTAGHVGSGSGGSGEAGSGISPLTLGPLLPESEWPKTIPSVQEWRAYGDSEAVFSLSDQTRIWASPGSEALMEAAQTLADDLNASFGFQPNVMEGVDPGPADIALALIDADPILGKEGYVLAVGDRVTIQAGTVQGAFWATRTLLQLLSQHVSLASGAARDWPKYAERGFMIDNGRSYFTPDWLRTQVQRLSYPSASSGPECLGVAETVRGCRRIPIPGGSSGTFARTDALSGHRFEGVG